MKKLISIILMTLMLTSCVSEPFKIEETEETETIESECSTTREVTTITTIESQETENNSVGTSLNEEELLEKWKNEIEKIKSDENIEEEIPPSFYQVDNYLIAVYLVEGDIFGGVYCLMNNDQIIHFYALFYWTTKINIDDNKIYIYGEDVNNGYNHFNLDIFDLSTSECIGNCSIRYSIGHPETEELINSDFPAIKSLDDLKKYIEYDKETIEKKLKEMEGITEESIRDMKWSPDGDVLIYYANGVEYNCDVYLWELGKRQPKKANIDIFGGISSFGWSPNSEYVLVDNGTTPIRSIMLINKYGDEKICNFNMLGCTLEDLWSEDSSKIAIGKYNDKIIAFPGHEVDGVFDIAVYDLNRMTEKTILKSSATEYYIFDKWVDNETITCSKFVPKNNEFGSVVEKKDVKIS